MWNDNDRKWLFEQMKKAGVDTGTYEDFSNSLKNQEDRDWYYDKSRSLGLKVGSTDDFASMMVEPVTQPQQAVEQQPQQVQTNVVQPVAQSVLAGASDQGRAVQTPQQQPTNYDALLHPRTRIPVPVPKDQAYTRMGDQGTFNPVRDWEQYEQAMRLTPQARRVIYGEQKARQMERYTREQEINELDEEVKGELDAFYKKKGITDPNKGFAMTNEESKEFNAILDRMREVDDMRKELDESQPKSVSEQLAEARNDLERMKRSLKSRKARDEENDRLSGLNSDPSLVGMMANNSRYDTQLAAIRTLEDRIRTLEAEEDDKGQSMFWRGFWDAMRDPSVWSLGVSDLNTSVELTKIKDKIDAGEELTLAEQTLLQTTIDKQEAEQQYGDHGFMYRAGSITMNALPFVGEFLVSGGGLDFVNAAGKATAKASAKMAAKAAAEGAGKSAVNNATTRWIVKNTGVLADDVTRGFLMANTTGAARTASDVMNRHMGQVIETEDGYQFVGGEDWGDAIYHGEIANTLEYYTEMLGAHFGGAGSAIGRSLDKGLNKIGLSKMSGVLNRIKGSQFYQAGDNLLAKGGVHDLIGEGMEEEANLVLNSLLVGDNQLSDLFDGRTQADIWGGMALSLGFMRAPQYAGSGYQTAQYYRYKQKTHNADVVAGYRLTSDKWEPIRDRIDNAPNEEMADVITDVLSSEELQPQEKEAVMSYVNNLLQMRGYNMGTIANAKDIIGNEDVEGQQAEQSIEQSYGNGYNASDDEMNDAKNMMDFQRQRIGEFASDELIAQLDADPITTLNGIRTSEAWTDEEKQTATDYVNAKATFDGMIQHVRDDIDSRITASDAAIDSHVHNDDGMIHPATMKVDDRKVYVIGGKVVMSEDGTMIDHDNSDESIIIRDAETGNIEFADPRDILSLDETLDAAQEKEIAQEAIRQEYAQQAADKIDGVLPFNDGDSYTATDDQGQQHTVVIVPNGTANSQGQILQADDGEVLASVDGAEPAPMSREAIQSMVEATNLARLQQFEQERAATRSQQREQQREASRPVYNINDEVTLQTDEGPVRGSITAEANEDGQIEVYTERPIGGKKINLYNRDELDAMLIEHNGAQQQVETPAGEIAGTTAQQADGETQLPPLTNEGIDAMLGAAPAAGTAAAQAESGLDNAGGEAGGENATGANNPPAAAPSAPAADAAGTTAEPMPMIGEGEDAEPDFTKASPERAHSFIYNEAGLSRDEANQFVEANKKVADKALTTIQGKKPKMGTSLAKYRRETSEWEQKVAQAKQQADYWKQVKDEQAKVVAAERTVQAERDAQLHEQAVTDEQARQAAVMQQREEQARLGSNNVAAKITEKWEAAPKVEGARNELVLANGEKVPGRYVLVESGAATPSHNPAAGFTKNEGFPMDENEQSVNDRDYERDQDAQAITRQIADQYDSRAMQTPVVVSSEGVVLSGNGRTMAGELAAQNGTDGAYIDHLKKYGQQYGFTPEQVESMQHPRVLFIPDEAMPYTADTFAKFNQQEMKGQSKTEQAVKLGKIVDNDTFGRVIRSINAFDTLGDFYADPTATTEAINELLGAGAISQAQYAEMFDGDGISAQGKEILENMLIGKAFESNPDAVREITAFKGVRQSIITALAEISNNLMLGKGFSLESELAQAIDLVYKARNEGYKAGDMVSGYARQLNLFPFDEGESVADYTNATVLMLADVMNDNRVTRLKKWLTLYNHAAQESANGQMDIFSGGIKSQADIINDVKQLLNYGTEEEQQTAIDTATQQRTAAASTEQPSGTDAGAEQDGTGSNGDTGNAVASTDESVGGTDAAVASAESETATNPTDGQKEAGNYKKGHVSIDGFDISIENPKGSERSGKDASGRPWSVTMQNTYGYIRRTEGVDGDHIDVFLSDHLDDWNGMVYVVDQVNADGSFDEHKVMYGFNSAEEAAAAYNSNYSEGWQGLGTITGVTKEEFKKWVDSSHRKTKPFAEYKSVKPLGGQNVSHIEQGNERKSAIEPESYEVSDKEISRTASGFVQETPEQAAEFDKRVPDMSDEELLAYMSADGHGDVNKAYHMTVYDEYDYRHSGEQTDAYDAYTQMLHESATTKEQAEEMLAGIRSNMDALATDERPMLLGREEALQEYIDELEAQDENERFRDDEEEDVEAVNEQFNERLDELDKDRNQKDRVLHLGHPGTFLLNGGIADGEIVMDFDRFVRKSSENYGNSHPFTAEDIKDLPKAINAPIAVFDSASNNDKVILTELKKDGKNFIVAIRTTSQPRKGGVTLEINEITTLYPKNAKGIVKWIFDGRHTQIDKEKALRWIEALRPHVGTPISEEHNSESSPLRDQQRTNLTDVDSKELDSAAKIVENFENPKLSEENLREGEEVALAQQHTERTRKRTAAQERKAMEFAQRQWRRAHDLANEWAQKLGLTDVMQIVDSIEDVEGNESFSKRKRRAKGWYDPKTGKIVIVLGNHRSPSDVLETILHEAVGHYGLRRLFGQNFNTFLDNVYQAGSLDIKERIADLAVGLRAKDSGANRTRRTNDEYLRIATEEYLAGLAEDTDFENAENRPWANHWFNKIKELFLQMLDKIGLRGFDKEGVELSDNELRYILWRSFKNLSEPGRYRNVFDVAENTSMEVKLGVGNGAKVIRMGHLEDEIPLQVMNRKDEEKIRQRVAHMSAVEAKAAYERVNAQMMDEEGLDLDEHLEKTKRDWIAEHGIKGVGKQQADELQKAMDKYGSGMVKLRWELKDRLDELGVDIAMEESRMRNEGDIEAINERFNKDLDSYIKGDLPTGYRFELGYPSVELRSAGFDDLPISMRASLLARKAGDESHPFDALDLRDLVNALQKPIAIFSYSKDYMRNLIVDVSHGDKHFLVGVTLNYRANGIEINSVSGLFPKESHEWIKWIQDGKALRIDQKDKVQDLIDSLRTNPAESERIGLNLDSAAKIVENFENPKLSEENFDEGGELFRDGDSDGTREAYNKKVNTGRKKTARMTAYNFREAFQDSLLSVKKLQEVIEQKYGMKLASYEDAWKYENALSSINMQQRKRFIDTLYEPMMKVADKLLKAGARVEELNEYLICKHGLERNRVFAERDAQKEYDALVADGKPADLNALIAEKRERDYSGLTEITGKDDIAKIEAEAEGRVQAFEQKYGSTCDDLWDAINKTTKWTLEKSYRSGMMSKQTYEKVRDMFEWYVPLRGWDAETAEDAYDYMMGDRGAFNGTLKTAEGRTSTADDPLATIGNMGESAILQGNRNILKRRLLNMAMNYPTDVCTVRDMWVVENAQGEWVANFPQIPEDATADEVAQILEQHEADMEALAQQGKAHRQRNSLDIDFHINQRDVPEHAVVAYLNGQQHVVYINGNPRAAQAINGRTGEDNSSKNPILRLVDFLFKDIKRFYSSAITGYSPNFAVANIVRDLGHCIAMTYVNKGALGMARYVAHLPQSIAYVIKNQIGRGGNAKADRYFKEFVENGGITGYAHLNDVDHWKADNAKRWARLSALKKGRVAPVRGVKAFISALGWFSETLELIPRFNTYWSEREDGKDVATAIKAAKDITVNFNKKGSELTPGVWGAVANTLRYEKMFFNPIVQGLNQFYEAGKAHPVRFAVATLHLPVLGAIAPYVNMLLVEAFGGGDGDDDKDKYDYWLQNEYTRRNNVLLFTGKGYVKIPIAPGFRELYGMGEALATRMFGKADNMETARALADQLRTVFSVEGQSSYREWSMSRFILPEHLAPLVDIMNNENFTGGTLYYDNQYREHEPEYQKAKQSTWSPLVSASKQLNEWLGGDEDIAAPLSGKWMNPAVWQHLISNYGGGFSQLVGDVTSTASNFIEGKEQDASQWPMLKRFYMKPTVERAQWARYGQYKKYKEDYDLAKEKYSAIRKKDLGPMEEAEAVDAFARRFPRAAAIYSAWEGGVRGADYVNRLQRLKKAGEEDEYWQLIKEAVEAAERATKKGTGESEEENDERP